VNQNTGEAALRDVRPAHFFQSKRRGNGGQIGIHAGTIFFFWYGRRTSLGSPNRRPISSQPQTIRDIDYGKITASVDSGRADRKAGFHHTPSALGRRMRRSLIQTPHRQRPGDFFQVSVYRQIVAQHFHVACDRQSPEHQFSSRAFFPLR